MLELDDDLLDHLATVRGQYIWCFLDAIAQAQARTEHEAGRVLVEGTLRTDDRALGHLIDIFEVGVDGKVQPIHVIHRSFSPWREVSYPLGLATLLVSEVVWFAVELVVEPTPDIASLQAWFEHWQTDGFAVEHPLGGRVHFLAIERREGGSAALALDLGSAPVEALRDLIDRCVESGARKLHLHSVPAALAGTSPA